jgi:hypothetical protein
MRTGEVTPLDRISEITGASAAARASASATHARQPASRACGVAPGFIPISPRPQTKTQALSVAANDGPILASVRLIRDRHPLKQRP